jgi:hemolysin activation/secretion protein
LEGESSTWSVGFTYPWLRGRMTNVYANFNQANKQMVDRSSAGVLKDKRVAASTLGLSGDWLDVAGGGGQSTWNLGLTGGDLDLSRLPADLAVDSAGYRTAGRYNKLSYGIARLQKLPGWFTVYGNLSGQVSDQNLDSTEKFLAGGSNGVRAYPGAEGLADHGLLANLELRYDLPADPSWGRLQVQAFYDTAWVRLHHDTADLPILTASARNQYRIGGLGVGVSLNKTDRYSIRAALAGKVGNNPGRTADGKDADGRADDTRLWVQAVVFF